MPDWLSERNAIDGYDPYYQHLGSVIAENFGRGLTESFDRERDSRHYDDLLSSISPQYSAMDPVARRRLSTSMATVAKQGGFGVNNLLQGMQQARQQKQFEQDLPALAAARQRQMGALGQYITPEEATAQIRAESTGRQGFSGGEAAAALTAKRLSDAANGNRMTDSRVDLNNLHGRVYESRANNIDARTPAQVAADVALGGMRDAAAGKSIAQTGFITATQEPTVAKLNAQANQANSTAGLRDAQAGDITDTFESRKNKMDNEAGLIAAKTHAANMAADSTQQAPGSPFIASPNDKAKMSNLRTTISAIQKQIGNVTNELYFAPDEEGKKNARVKLDVLKKQLDGYVDQMKKVTDAQPTLPPFINGIAGPVATPATFDKPIILQQGAPLFGDSTGQALPPSPPVGSLNTMPTVPTHPTASTNAAPVQIASDEEFDALPSGTLFTDPSGKVRRKP